MYSRAQASQIREAFWTALGRFMAPTPDSEGEKTNWINYATGHKGLYFRMDVDAKQASISVLMRQTDPLLQTLYFEKFDELRTWFTDTLGEEWTWEPDGHDEHGKPVSKIYTVLPGVSIFRQEDWPAIITFLRPRMIALDAFWNEVKDGFEELR